MSEVVHADEHGRVTAQGHRLDGLRCTVYAHREPDATWTLFGVPYRGRLAPTGHGSAAGVRLTAAAMTGLCQAVLERAQ